jgi:hypothetical protein
VNRRHLPALAAALLIGASGCGDGDTDTANGPDDAAAESDPTSVTADPTTTAVPTTTTPATRPTIAPPLIPPPIKDTSPGDPVPSTPPEAPVTNPSDPTAPNGSNVEIAVAELAVRLDVDPSEIEVVSVEEVTWPDGSLGCPRPGMSYTQALVNGQLIVLAVDGIDHEYHSGRGREPFYCPADQATPPASGGYGDT